MNYWMCDDKSLVLLLRGLHQCVMADLLNPGVITPESVKRELIIFLGLILSVSKYCYVSLTIELNISHLFPQS